MVLKYVILIEILYFICDTKFFIKTYVRKGLENMVRTICLFNNKGGVSKTTTTFHLGWKIAEKGFKTLIVDTDPQCNLTGLCLNTDKDNKLEHFYIGNHNNLKESLSPVFSGALSPLKPTTCYDIADFNSLIAQSQANNTPVFLLTQEQVQKGGNVWRNMKKNIDDFNETFDCLADRIIKATK